MNAETMLATLPLFAGMSAEERRHLAGLMTAFSVPAGTVLFEEGDPGDAMYLVHVGRLEAVRPGPEGWGDVQLATLGEGAIVGEMSLMGSGTRTATVMAVEPTYGYALDRTTFDVLRADRRPGSLALIQGIGQLAVTRLGQRYAAVAASLEAGDPGPAGELPGLGLADPNLADAAYLASTLFFRDCSADEVDALSTGVVRHTVERGAAVVRPGAVVPALYLVARGAVETTVRGAGQAHRVRLAGPGRALGHLGVLGPAPSLVECRARERTVLLEYPWDRVRALLSADDSAARRFSAAFYEDAVRALHQADRPRMRLRDAREVSLQA